MTTRKLISCFLLFFVVILCGCGAPAAPETTMPYTYPEDARLCGVAVGGMTREEAHAAVENAIKSYTLRVVVEGTETVLTAGDLGLELRDDRIFVGREAELISLLAGIREDEEAGRELAYVAFSPEFSCFVPEDGVDRIHWDYAAVTAEICAAVAELNGEVVTAPTAVTVPGEIAAGKPEIVAAADRLNAILDNLPTLSFTIPGDWETSYETPEKDTAASWVTIGEDGVSYTVNEEALGEYCRSMAEAYSDLGEPALAFLASDGRTVILEDAEGGMGVDTGALFDVLSQAILQGDVTEYEAAYIYGEAAPRYTDFDGSYLEVDLDNQRIYCYRDGELKVESGCVSGCVATGNTTPTGLYHIYHMSTDAWLEGPTWRDHVDYWMAFYGGYGLHDASWRSVFEPDVYLRDGSHGCVNLPVDVAGIIYYNIDYGTPVVLYGGLKELP